MRVRLCLPVIVKLVISLGKVIKYVMNDVFISGG